MRHITARLARTSERYQAARRDAVAADLAEQRRDAQHASAMTHTRWLG